VIQESVGRVQASAPSWPRPLVLAMKPLLCLQSNIAACYCSMEVLVVLGFANE